MTISADTAVRRPGGRTARTRSVVLDAARSELVDGDHTAVSLDRIATRAGVPRSTIYRRWGGLDGLLLDAIETFAVDQAQLPDTGHIDTDLSQWAHSIRHTLTDRVSGGLVAALFNGGRNLQADTLRRRFWQVRAALVRPVVERAMHRGQLPTGTDPDEVIRHIGAPLYYRLLVLGEPVTQHAADLAAAVTCAAAHAGVFVTDPPPRD